MAAAAPRPGDWLNGIWLDQVSTVAAHGTEGVRYYVPVVQAKPAVYQWTRLLGVQLLRRLSTLVFTLLTLYFVYSQPRVPGTGRAAGRAPAVRANSRRADDPRRRSNSATVDGIVLVAVAEGAIMAGVYAVAGAPHPIWFGTVTGVLAMIPFAAPVAFGAVALLLASQNAVGPAIGGARCPAASCCSLPTIRTSGHHSRRCQVAVPVLLASWAVSSRSGWSGFSSCSP